jgi:hypothetical protein
MTIIPFHFPRIVRESGGAWLVIYRSFGWAFGSRHEALAAWRELAQEAR